MLNFILRRLVLTLPILVLVAMLVFLIGELIPGDPVDMLTLGQPVDAATRAALRAEYGLDRPVAVRYWDYLTGLARLDLGRSVRTRQPVLEELLVRYPNTILIALTSLLVAVAIGVPAGIVSAAYHNRAPDWIVSILVTIGVSTPAFWLGLVLMQQFAVKLKWFPVMGFQSWRHLVLPAMTLGLIYCTIIAGLVRSALLESLRKDYVRTARAKGIRESRVVLRHALRNALIPVVTIVGLQLSALLSGAVIVEVVFAFPGVGDLAVKSILYRDYPMIQGITLVVALTTVLVNLLTDVSYAAVNPTIQYA